MKRITFLVGVLLLGTRIAAAQRITDLPALTQPSIDDLLYVVDGPATTPTGKKVALGNLFSAAVLTVGTGASNNSTDARIIIARDVDDSVSGNGHAFSDSSDITRGGGIAYNSYDARVEFMGSEDYSHFAGFQSGVVYGSSGTITNLYNFYSKPTFTAGACTYNYGFYADDPVDSPVQPYINYGLYIAEQTGGQNNYAIFVHEGNTSWLGGTTYAAKTEDGAESIPVIVRNYGNTDYTAAALGFRAAQSTSMTAKIVSQKVGTSHNLQFWSYGGSALFECFRCTPNGRMGIRTTAPDGTVEINLGTSGHVRLSYNDPDGSATYYATLAVSSAGKLTLTAVGANSPTLAIDPAANGIEINGAAVTYGANDSGGSGYRCLRIPNP